MWTKGLLVAVFAGIGLQEPTADDILGRIEKGLEGIEDYTVQLQATVDMERLQVPSMTATMYFKAPDKMHFESSSFAMLPREGLALNPSDLRRNFMGEYLGKDTLEGMPSVVVRLRPRSDESRRKAITLWVDPTRWVIRQMRTQPFEGRRLMVRFTYTHVENRFWLPETLVVSFETLTPSPEGGPPLPGATPNVQRRRQPLREGTIKVVYSEYAVNTGLSEEVFEEQKEQP